MAIEGNSRLECGITEITPQNGVLETEKGTTTICEEVQMEDEAAEMVTSATISSIANGDWGDSQYDGNLLQILGNIEFCGNLLHSWNLKKREAHQKDIVSRMRELQAANNVDIPKSWGDIRKIEDKLDEVLKVEESCPSHPYHSTTHPDISKPEPTRRRQAAASSTSSFGQLLERKEDASLPSSSSPSCRPLLAAVTPSCRTKEPSATVHSSAAGYKVGLWDICSQILGVLVGRETVRL
ncbi:hypothetical protein LWI28_016599 [Acer negundo]|uniref:Uncharacterized protein n=1 Tax=Acer negundo TaxID=4023 RepID=A0AAD5JGN6_ACENE|nr:hypothetical protein LWI28_016599 [Acer negundo]